MAIRPAQQGIELGNIQGYCPAIAFHRDFALRPSGCNLAIPYTLRAPQPDSAGNEGAPAIACTSSILSYCYWHAADLYVTHGINSFDACDHRFALALPGWHRKPHSSSRAG